MIAGSDTANGSASVLTERSGSLASLANNARRVGSASAAKVRSRGVSSLYLTMWLRIDGGGALSSALGRIFTHLGASPRIRERISVRDRTAMLRRGGAVTPSP